MIFMCILSIHVPVSPVYINALVLFNDFRESYYTVKITESSYDQE